MKSPDEIKKWLECCFINNCDGCPYDTDGCADNEEKADTLAYIEQLEQRIAQVERERDALKHDLNACFIRPTKMCRVCENIKTKACNMCERGDLFKWRGVCPENTKEAND